MQTHPSLLSRRRATLSGPENDRLTPQHTQERANTKFRQYHREIKEVHGPPLTRPDSAKAPIRYYAPLPLLQARSDALHTLSVCRNVIASLELTRMRKSRIGFSYWVAFWERIYERPLARSLTCRVSIVRAKVETIFQKASKELNELTWKVEGAVTAAISEKEVLRLLEHMEADVALHRRRRRKRAQALLEKLRTSIQEIPVDVSDELFDDLKRGIFALDPFCDYHPGDPEAEERDRQPNDEPLEADGFIDADPQLAYRSGFGEEFYGAIERAAVQHGGDLHFEHVENWINGSEEDSMQWRRREIHDDAFW